ncbi:hypothetical protein ACROYT_G012689 [Oculina patagonica]
MSPCERREEKKTGIERASEIEWKSSLCDGVERGKLEIQEKTLGAKTRTNNKLNPHVMQGLGIEPRPVIGGR